MSAKSSPANPRAMRVRVSIEFPASLLRRVDAAARSLAISRSAFIRNSVGRLIEDINTRAFERELARGYAANAGMNRALAREFSHVDWAG